MRVWWRTGELVLARISLGFFVFTVALSPVLEWLTGIPFLSWLEFGLYVQVSLVAWGLLQWLANSRVQPLKSDELMKMTPRESFELLSRQQEHMMKRWNDSVGIFAMSVGLLLIGFIVILILYLF